MKCYLYKYNDQGDILGENDNNRTLIMTIYCDEKDVNTLIRWVVRQGIADHSNYFVEKAHHFVAAPGGRFSGLIEVLD